MRCNVHENRWGFMLEMSVNLWYSEMTSGSVMNADLSRCDFPSIFLVVFVVIPTIITLSPIDGILLKSKLPNNLMDVAFTLREESKVVN